MSSTAFDWQLSHLGNFPAQAMDVVIDVQEERRRQDDKWGPQTHRDGTGPSGFHTHIVGVADRYRKECQNAAEKGEVTWRHIFLEEVYEAVAESDVTKLREELIQVMAVAQHWVEDIDAQRLVDGR